MRHVSVLRGLAREANGTYRLLFDALVEAALWAPVRDMAVVTTSGSLGVALLVCWLRASLK